MLMRDMLGDGVRAFNEERFFDAHEIWEDLWRATAEPALRRCYQGLIQAAVALYHLQQGNLFGAESQLGKSIRNLESGDGSTTGLDIGGLVIELRKLRQRVVTSSDLDMLPPRIARLQ